MPGSADRDHRESGERVSEQADAGRRPAGRGFGTVARLFHWVIAAMILIQIPAGIAMTSEPLLVTHDALYILHKGMGSVLLVLVVARILWRVTHRPPPFPDYMPSLEQRIAGATHWFIYVALLVQVISGYVRTVGDGFPIELLDAFGIPPLIPRMTDTAQVMLVVHQFTAAVLIALVAVHVSAVLRHQLVERNPALARMWPPWASRSLGDDTGETVDDR